MLYLWTKSPEKTPDKPTYVEIEFEKGIPVALDGEKMDGVSLIGKLNEIAGDNGVGRIDHIENRLVGIKSREVYEAPAPIVLLQAHLALEEMTLTKQQLRFKQKVAVEYSDLIYNGLWFSAMHQDLAAYVQSTQRFVTGTVRVKLFKGTSMVVGRKSPYSLYSFKLATYDKGDIFDQSASVGFIQLWGLPSKTQAQLQPLDEVDSPLNSLKTTRKGQEVSLIRGRFQKEADEAVSQYTASLPFDWRLYRYDIAGSIAHAKMLAKQGIISDNGCKSDSSRAEGD